MKKYRVEIEAIVSKIITVSADSEEEAEEMANELFEESPTHFYQDAVVSIKVVTDSKKSNNEARP